MECIFWNHLCCSSIMSRLDKRINIYLLASSVLCYLHNNFVFKVTTSGPIRYICKCYLNDYLAGIFILSLANIFLLDYGRELIHLKEILLFILSASFVWEFTAPLIQNSSTTDMLDILVYILGAIVYYVLIKMFKGGNDYETY